MGNNATWGAEWEWRGDRVKAWSVEATAHSKDNGQLTKRWKAFWAGLMEIWNVNGENGKESGGREVLKRGGPKRAWVITSWPATFGVAHRKKKKTQPWNTLAYQGTNRLQMWLRLWLMFCLVLLLYFIFLHIPKVLIWIKYYDILSKVAKIMIFCAGGYDQHLTYPVHSFARCLEEAWRCILACISIFYFLFSVYFSCSIFDRMLYSTPYRVICYLLVQ